VWANNLFAMSLADGSISQILAAVGAGVGPSNDTFLSPKYVAFGFPIVAKTNKYNKASQQRLWEISEELTSVKFL